MKEFNYFKLFFWFAIGLIIYVLLATGLLYYQGNYDPDWDISELLMFGNVIVGMATLGFSLWTIIYSAMQKRYGYIVLGLLEIVFAIYLYLLIVVIAMMNFY